MEYDNKLHKMGQFVCQFMALVSDNKKIPFLLKIVIWALAIILYPVILLLALVVGSFVCAGQSVYYCCFGPCKYTFRRVNCKMIVFGLLMLVPWLTFFALFLGLYLVIAAIVYALILVPTWLLMIIFTVKMLINWMPELRPKQFREPTKYTTNE